MKKKFCKSFICNNFIDIYSRNSIKGQECHFVGKYYYLKQGAKIDDINKNDLKNNINLKEALLMEFYQYKSLDQFKMTYGATISLNTKIFILYQTAQGLKFLKQNNIFHLDLKPGNILVNIFFH